MAEILPIRRETLSNRSISQYFFNYRHTIGSFCYILFQFLSLSQRPWSMAICLVWKSVYNWGMVETGPFFGRGRTVASEGGGAGSFLKINCLAVKHLKINILAWPGSLENK